MKRLGLFAAVAAVLVFAASVSGCAQKSEGLQVKAEGTVLASKTLDSKKDYLVKYDRVTVFRYAFEKTEKKKIKYIKTGTKVTLNFGSFKPGKVAVSDVLLSKDGNQYYANTLSQSVKLQKEGKSYMFPVHINWASGLSDVYKPKGYKDYQGYLVTAQKGKERRTYAFVIKTDSATAQ